MIEELEKSQINPKLCIDFISVFKKTILQLGF